MCFIEDLKFGNSYEKKALEYLKYSNVEFSKGCFKPYDFIIDGKTKYEVKSDRLGYKTGNLAIEYSCNDKPSGISTTEADYWMYFIISNNKIDCYKIPVTDLYNLIKDCRKVKGGDGYKSKMVLLPISKCQKYLLSKINR